MPHVRARRDLVIRQALLATVEDLVEHAVGHMDAQLVRDTRHRVACGHFVDDGFRDVKASRQLPYLCLVQGHQRIDVSGAVAVPCEVADEVLMLKLKYLFLFP